MNKEMECIALIRLVFWLKLSPRLHGFLPQQSTHHCLMELYPHIFPLSIAAFLGLKLPFDVANRDIILNYLVNNILRWIMEYLCHLCTKAYSFYPTDALPTFFSPQHAWYLTFNVDAICIQFNSPEDLQPFLILSSAFT